MGQEGACNIQLVQSFVQPICPTIFSLSYPFHIVSPEGATLLSGHQPRQWYQVQESVYNALQLRVTTSRKVYDWLWGLSRRATLPSLTTLQGDWPASSWCTTRPAPLKVKYCLFYSSYVAEISRLPVNMLALRMNFIVSILVCFSLA